MAVEPGRGSGVATTSAYRTVIAVFLLYLVSNSSSTSTERHERLLLRKRKSLSKGEAATLARALDQLSCKYSINPLKRIKDVLIVDVDEDCNHHENARQIVKDTASRLGFEVVPDLVVHPKAAPSPTDTGTSAVSPDNLWGLRAVGVMNGSKGEWLGAWNRTMGNQAVRVCIIDSGIDYFHPALAGNIWSNPGEIPGNGIDDDGNGFIDDYHGYSFVSSGGRLYDPMDDAFHGTHLAGIVGAHFSSNSSVSGISPKVNLIACKFLRTDLSGLVSDALRCLDYCLVVGAHITLNSYGGAWNSPVFEDAIAEVGQQRQLFVTAAGNYRLNLTTDPVYPASFGQDIILSVGASDRNDQLVEAFSNFGVQDVDLVAPGIDIVSSSVPEQYRVVNGTSQSAAFVAGAAALLLSAYAEMGFNITGQGLVLKELILSSVDVKPDLIGKCLTGGRLNVAKAMELVPYAEEVNASATAEQLPIGFQVTANLQSATLQSSSLQRLATTVTPSPAAAGSALQPGSTSAPVSTTQPSSTPPPPPPPTSGPDPFQSTGLAANSVSEEGTAVSCMYHQLRMLDTRAGSGVAVVFQAHDKAAQNWSVCTTDGLDAFHSSPLYGAFVQDQLMSTGRATIRINGTLIWSGERIYEIDILANGTVQPHVPESYDLDYDLDGYGYGDEYYGMPYGGLTLSAGGALTRRLLVGEEDGAGDAALPSHGDLQSAVYAVTSRPALHTRRRHLASASVHGQESPEAWLQFLSSAPQIVALGSRLLYTQDSMVSVYERGDRLVVSWINVTSTQTNETGSFQIEVFSASTELPQSSIRLTYLDMVVNEALLGWNMEAGQLDDCVEQPQDPEPLSVVPEMCAPLAPLLKVMPDEIAVAEAQHEEGSVDSAIYVLDLQNLGSKPLPFVLATVPSGHNSIEPSQWLNEATDYSASFASNPITCTRATSRGDPLCAWFNSSLGSAAFSGRHTPARPPRFHKPLLLPVWLRGTSVREGMCDNHFLMLSNTPTPGRYSGQAGSVKMSMGCMDKALHTFRDGGYIAGCADYGRTSWNILVDNQHVWFFTSHCSLLKAAHDLGSGPLYLFFGADCSPSSCSGEGAVWESLEILTSLQPDLPVPGNGSSFLGAEEGGSRGTNATSSPLPVEGEQSASAVPEANAANASAPHKASGAQSPTAPARTLLAGLTGAPVPLLVGAAEAGKVAAEGGYLAALALLRPQADAEQRGRGCICGRARLPQSGRHEGLGRAAALQRGNGVLRNRRMLKSAAADAPGCRCPQPGQAMRVVETGSGVEMSVLQPAAAAGASASSRAVLSAAQEPSESEEGVLFPSSDLLHRVLGDAVPHVSWLSLKPMGRTGGCKDAAFDGLIPPLSTTRFQICINGSDTERGSVKADLVVESLGAVHDLIYVPVSSYFGQ